MKRMHYAFYHSIPACLPIGMACLPIGMACLPIGMGEVMLEFIGEGREVGRTDDNGCPALPIGKGEAKA